MHVDGLLGRAAEEGCRRQRWAAHGGADELVEEDHLCADVRTGMWRCIGMTLYDYGPI